MINKFVFLLSSILCFSTSYATSVVINNENTKNRSFVKTLEKSSGIALESNICNSEPDETVVYKMIGDVELSMHFFFPENHNRNDKTSAILLFHGGGWTTGGPSQFFKQSAYFAYRGLVAISVQYRIKDINNTSPIECVKDAKSAMRWVRRNAITYGIDPDRIIAGGGSAGGHLAAATAILDDFNEVGEDTTVSCKPKALVLWNPVVNNGPNGYGYNTVFDYWESFSPYHNLDTNTPPTLIMLGTEDTLFTSELAEAYRIKMEDNETRCDLIFYEGEEHGFFNSPDRHYQTMEDANMFLTSLGYLEEYPIIDKVEFTAEAECAALYGTTTENIQVNASEGKFITIKDSGEVLFLVDNIPEAGKYELIVYRFNDGSLDEVILNINGSSSTVSLQPSNWAYVGSSQGTSIQVELKAGYNTLSFSYYNKGVYLDYIQVLEENNLSRVSFLDKQQEFYKIYPNLIEEDGLHIQFNEKVENTILKIFNLQGIHVYGAELNTLNKEYEIELPNRIKNGIYYLKMQDKGNVQTSKFILNR